jgi:hypothetical protein
MPAAKRKKAKAESAQLSILDVIDDPSIFGPWFEGDSWGAWRSFLKSMFGHELNDAELAIFKECTGRTAPAPGGYTEAAMVIGRRGAKSLHLALVAAFLAAFRDWTPYLTGGEVGHIVILSADRRSARAIFGYLKGMLTIPLLSGLLTRETQDLLELGSKRIAISIETASFKTIRGRTIIAGLCDESAFWSSDESGANPDSEVIAAIRPAMLSIPGAMLLLASSPFAEEGVLFEEHRKHFGKDESATLVWQAPTLTMNPKAPMRMINEMYESDPARAAAEYGAQFRNYASGYLSSEVVDAAIDTDVVMRAPNLLNNTYVAAVDSAGGGGQDSFTLGISYLDGDTVILAHVTEIRPPFSASDAVAQISKVLQLYGLTSVTGDRFSGSVISDLFAANGIQYRFSERDRSAIYADAAPMFTSSRIRLLDLPRLRTQLIGLERKVGGSKERIDHKRGQHDDVAQVACASIVLATSKSRGPQLYFGSVDTRSTSYGYVDDFKPTWG